MKAVRLTACGNPAQNLKMVEVPELYRPAQLKFKEDEPWPNRLRRHPCG